MQYCTIIRHFTDLNRHDLNSANLIMTVNLPTDLIKVIEYI